jgi:hypothetical protein
MLRKTSRLALVILVCGLAVGCGKYKRLADTAIKTADTAVASAGDDVVKYATDQWQPIINAVASAKESYAKGDYKAAIASLQDIGPKIQAAQAAASAKKTELENAWNDLSGGLPKMMDAIKSRVDILSASKKLPAGMDKAKLESAKSGLAAATSDWAAAQELSKAGKLTDAIAKGNSVKDQAAQIMQSLGMTPPPAAAAK